MNIGAAFARVKNEIKNSAAKHHHENRRRTEPGAWIPVIEKQLNDLRMAVMKGDPALIRKEFGQVATAALLGTAAAEAQD